MITDTTNDSWLAGVQELLDRLDPSPVARCGIQECVHAAPDAHDEATWVGRFLAAA